MWRLGWTEAGRIGGLVLAALLLTAPLRAAEPAPDPELLARYEAALALLRQGDDAGAAGLLESLVAAHPDLAGPLFNLAAIRRRAGDDEGALALLARAGAVCQRCGPVWNQVGTLQRGQGRFADAEAAYQQAIRLEPDYAPAHYNLAVLYELYLQQPARALEGYQRYLTLAPGDDSVEVEKWVADLTRRTGATPVAAQAGAAP